MTGTKFWMEMYSKLFIIVVIIGILLNGLGINGSDVKDNGFATAIKNQIEKEITDNISVGFENLWKDL